MDTKKIKSAWGNWVFFSNFDMSLIEIQSFAAANCLFLLLIRGSQLLPNEFLFWHWPLLRYHSIKSLLVSWWMQSTKHKAQPFKTFSTRIWIFPPFWWSFDPFLLTFILLNAEKICLLTTTPQWVILLKFGSFWGQFLGVENEPNQCKITLCAYFRNFISRHFA